MTVEPTDNVSIIQLRCKCVAYQNALAELTTNYLTPVRRLYPLTYAGGQLGRAKKRTRFQETCSGWADDLILFTQLQPGDLCNQIRRRPMESSDCFSISRVAGSCPHSAIDIVCSGGGAAKLIEIQLPEAEHLHARADQKQSRASLFQPQELSCL